jgi:rRNA maturation endonuclease Nob1
MVVRKCDNCKKEIKQPNESIVAGIGFPEFSFCERCGKPITVFLKKRKLLQPNKTTG